MDEFTKRFYARAGYYSREERLEREKQGLPVAHPSKEGKLLRAKQLAKLKVKDRETE